MKFILPISSAMFLLLGFVNAAMAQNFQPPSVDRGRYLVHTSGCNNCHTSDPSHPLAGGRSLDTPAGKFFPPNITADRQNGIGNWSDANFIKAMRTGVSPSGSSYFPAFPYSNFTQLTDSDLLSIKAYIGTLPASANPRRSSNLGFFAGLPFVASVWNGTDSMLKPKAEHNQPRDFMLAVGPFPGFPQLDEAWNRGAYLVEGSLHCTQCHTPRTSQGHLIYNKWMGGSEMAPNITPSSRTSITNGWSKADWDLFLRTGRNPSGGQAVGEMAEVIAEQTRALTPQDRAAVIRYLSVLVPVQ